MSDKKTFNDWEKEYGCLVVGTPEKELTQAITKDEFEAIAFKDGKVPQGVNWDDRTKFLQENGYAINRKNMIDSSLSHKPAKSKK